MIPANMFSIILEKNGFIKALSPKEVVYNCVQMSLNNNYELF